MACETFKTTNFGQDALDRIDDVNKIIDAYQQQGLRLTLRQLYYQLVSANTIPNNERSYKRIGGLLSVHERNDPRCSVRAV